MRILFAAHGASTVHPAKLDDHTMLVNAIVMIVAMSRKNRITVLPTTKADDRLLLWIRELEDVLKLQCHRDVSPGSESGLDISWTEYIRRFCSAVFVEDDGIQEVGCLFVRVVSHCLSPSAFCTRRNRWLPRRSTTT